MRVDISGIAFLLIVCGVVPWMAWKSKQRLGTGPLPLPRNRLFIQVIVMHVWLLFVAVAAAQHDDIALFNAPKRPLIVWPLAAALVVLLVATARWRWPQRDAQSKARLYSMLPHDRKELGPYLAVCVSAGVCEEIVYRGTTAALLTRLTGNLLAAVLIASIVFGFAHLVQGWRSVFTITLIALGAHGLALLGASLYPVMAAHALYDALAGVLMPRWYEREVRSGPQVLSQSTLMR